MSTTKVNGHNTTRHFYKTARPPGKFDWWKTLPPCMVGCVTVQALYYNAALDSGVEATGAMRSSMTTLFLAIPAAFSASLWITWMLQLPGMIRHMANAFTGSIVTALVLFALTFAGVVYIGLFVRPVPVARVVAFTLGYDLTLGIIGGLVSALTVAAWIASNRAWMALTRVLRSL